MGVVQKRLNIKRDVKFHFLIPITALLASIVHRAVCILLILQLLSELNRFNSSLFFLRRHSRYLNSIHGYDCNLHTETNLTNIVGYLTMENGVVLFSLFLTELPLLIEVLIVVDLIMLTLIATILAFGIDSTIEEFHTRLNPFHDSQKKISSEFEDLEAEQ